ncbi:MAG: hypothetical protein Kilf2KO_47520 [Rhodospirillales bacterium]
MAAVAATGGQGIGEALGTQGDAARLFGGKAKGSGHGCFDLGTAAEMETV